MRSICLFVCFLHWRLLDYTLYCWIQAQHCHLVKGGDCPSGVSPPWMLCAVWGSTVQSFRDCPEKGHQGGESPQGQDLQAVADITLLAQPEGKKAEEWPYHSLQHLQGGQWRERCWSSLVTSKGTQGNGIKPSQSRFRLDNRKSFSTKKVANHWKSQWRGHGTKLVGVQELPGVCS